MQQVQNSELDVYPNPVNGQQMNVYIPEINEMVVIAINDLLGKGIITHRTWVATTNTFRVEHFYYIQSLTTWFHDF